MRVILLTAKVGLKLGAVARYSFWVRFPMLEFWICRTSRSGTRRGVSRLSRVRRHENRMLKIPLALVAMWISGTSLGRFGPALAQVALQYLCTVRVRARRVALPPSRR